MSPIQKFTVIWLCFCRRNYIPQKSSWIRSMPKWFQLPNTHAIRKESGGQSNLTKRPPRRRTRTVQSFTKWRLCAPRSNSWFHGYTRVHTPYISIGSAVFSERELTFTFAICYRPSVCLSSVCLSSVCNVRAPYSGNWNFRQYFCGIRYLGLPLTHIKNFTEIVPGEPLRRGS